MDKEAMSNTEERLAQAQQHIENELTLTEGEKDAGYEQLSAVQVAQARLQHLTTMAIELQAAHREVQLLKASSADKNKQLDGWWEYHNKTHEDRHKLIAELQTAQAEADALRKLLSRTYIHQTDWDTKYCGFCQSTEVYLDEVVKHDGDCPVAAALAEARSQAAEGDAGIKRPE